jgi:glycolate dehydrogenase iron-sulfur subunit
MEDLRALAGDCVHCGFCLPVCPTYQLWGDEMDSPRGRIHLMTQLMEGARLDAAVLPHLDYCLGCMACVTACPSGVRYDKLIEAARAWPLDEPRTPAQRAARAAIFAVFPYPRRLRLLAGPLRAAQKAGLDKLISRSGVAARLPATAAAALRLAPPPARRIRLPERVPAGGRRGSTDRPARRAVVGMLTGCVQGEFFPQVNAATARLLSAEGCDVIIPRGQGCCGALSLHSGRTGEAAALARRLAGVFDRAGVDAVVVNAAGCGSAMKEYAGLATSGGTGTAGSGHPDGPAARVGAKVRDLTEFLTELGPAAPRHPLPMTVAYHDACHLAHAQGVRAQPRALLQAIPGLSLVELADGGTCCGSAGVYNLLQPGPARELGERKADAVMAAKLAGAELLVSANPGCSLQISAALAARGEWIPIAHTAQVLDASVRGLPVTALTS